MERLNKFLAHAGVGSRRHCDTLIERGRVKVDGVRVTDLGTKIDPHVHQIAVDDTPVKVEKPVYWAVNKPVGYLCTNDDPDGRPRATDLLPHVEQRVYTVGRLDEGSEGLLLMTNDGDLAFHLMHPRYGVPKTYLVLVAGDPTPADMKKLTDGIWLSEGKVKAKSATRFKTQGDSAWLKVVLTEGKNREVRRMLAKSGHKVMKLRRVAIGPIKLDRLPKGKARRVSEGELTALRKYVDEAKEKIASGGKTATGKPPSDAGPDARPARPEARERKVIDRGRGGNRPDTRAPKPGERERGDKPFNSRPPKPGERERGEKPFRPRPPKPEREKTEARKPAARPSAPARPPRPPKKKSWGQKPPARPE